MINSENVVEIINQNKLLLPSILSRVEETQNQSLSFRLKPIESIKNHLIEKTQVLLFPSEDPCYGGLVTYRNGRFFIHINTNQPKIYENFIWAHEYYHYTYESEEIKNSTIRTFFDDAALNERERLANLFSAELLIDSRVLEIIFKSITSNHIEDRLELNVIRLIPAFELPYKALVVKLAQDGLITEQDAVNIIDFNYRENLPSDFDKSLLQRSLAIKINNLGSLLNDKVIEENMRQEDLNSFQALYQKYFKRLEILRDKEKE